VGFVFGVFSVRDGWVELDATRSAGERAGAAGGATAFTVAVGSVTGFAASRAEPFVDESFDS
jgi:hypothetical protein